MSITTQNTVFGVEFSKEFYKKVNSTQTLLRPYVSEESLTTSQLWFDSVGSVETHEVKGANQATQYSDISHFRRAVTTRRYAAALKMDETVTDDMVLNPYGDYLTRLTESYNRRLDRVIVDSVYAPVKVGADLGTSVDYVTDGVRVVDATAGNHYTNFRTAKSIFPRQGINEPLVFAGSVDEDIAMMGEVEFINADFKNSVLSAPTGAVSSVMGVDKVTFPDGELIGDGYVEPVPVVAGQRKCFLMTTSKGMSGVRLYKKQDLTVRTDLLPTENYSKQVHMIFSIGGLRIDGKRIVEYKTTKVGI